MKLAPLSVLGSVCTYTSSLKGGPELSKQSHILAEWRTGSTPQTVSEKIWGRVSVRRYLAAIMGIILGRVSTYQR